MIAHHSKLTPFIHIVLSINIYQYFVTDIYSVTANPKIKISDFFLPYSIHLLHPKNRVYFGNFLSLPFTFFVLPSLINSPLRSTNVRFNSGSKVSTVLFVNRL